MRNLLRLCLVLSMAILFGREGTLQAQVYLNYTVNQPAALAADAGADIIICTGGNTNLGGTPAAMNGYGGYTYTWAPSASLNNAAIANPTASPSASTFYMLQVNDSMGCTAMDTIEVVVDTCIGLGNVASISKFDVFPNPNEGKFTVSIELEKLQANIQLNIIDMQGRVIYAKEVEVNGMTVKEEITLEGFSRGTYFIQMEADGKLLSRKMILR